MKQSYGLVHHYLSVSMQKQLSLSFFHLSLKREDEKREQMTKCSNKAKTTFSSRGRRDRYGSPFFFWLKCHLRPKLGKKRISVQVLHGIFSSFKANFPVSAPFFILALGPKDFQMKRCEVKEVKK